MSKIVDGVYYGSDGHPAHRGIVKIDDKIYYAGENGILVKDSRKTIHHGMGNGMVHHGSYYFDADGICDLNSFQEVKDEESEKKKKTGKITIKNIIAIKKQDKKILITIACFAIVFILAMAGVSIAQKYSNKASAEKAEDAAQESKQIEMTLPEFNGEVYLCSNNLESYYKGECTLREAVESGADAYQPFVFEYTIDNAETATMLISESDDYSDSIKYELDVRASDISVDNLKTNTTYYYLVTAKNTDGTSQSNGGTFRTADTNRFISFDGVYNTRDIGGYDTLYGKKVKQGVLIRGTELDGLVESTYYLQDVTQTEPFGFVCDFDLRSAEIFNTTYVSRLGENVTHKFYNSPMYGGIFTVGTETLLKEIFTDLADERNYPMYLHCTYGADRTGTIVFLLQGLLGVSEEDMMREYELTGFFSNGYVYGDNINAVYSGVQGCDGDTLNEKIENYMMDTVGITHEQIENIREIFLEDAVK